MKKRSLEEKYAAKQICWDDKSAVLNKDVYYEIITALGVSVCGRLDYPLWEHVNFSRLGHARALCDFFKRGKRWRSKHKWQADGVISSDFGFPAKRLKLGVDDSRRLNKDMFHLTYSRLRFKNHQELKAWRDAVLVAVHERCVEFVDHLLSGKTPKKIVVDKQRWTELRDMLNNGKEICLRYDSDWLLEAGRSLKGKYSELLECVALPNGVQANAAPPNVAFVSFGGSRENAEGQV